MIRSLQQFVLVAVAAPVHAAPAGMKRRVSIVSTAKGYAPATLSIVPGTTVTWTNNDKTVAHMVNSVGGSEMTSGTMNSGATWSYTFTKPGRFNYMCAMHPTMPHGTIIVRAGSAAPAGHTRRRVTHRRTSG